MSDNKSYRGPLDRSKVAGNEPYEMRYLVDKMSREFPDHSKKDVQQAAKESVAVKQFHNSRPMIENSIRLKLRNR
jgi:hypothetical protein